MPHDDERWQAYTEQGTQITSSAGALTKAQCAAGALHGNAHVWIWRKSGGAIEVLVQLRAAGKKTWPNHLDISAAGHIDFDETPIQAAVRETREELGLTLDVSQLKLLFVHHQHMKDETSGVIENEFQWVYGYELTGAVAMRYQQSEVGATTWLTLADFERLSTAKNAAQPLVPHGDAYFKSLLRGVAMAEET